MQTFKKYFSIENSFRKKNIAFIIEMELDQGEFIVQEKIHGANLSFWTDGKTIRCAKRTGFIEADEKFYNYRLAMEKYKQSILRAFQLIKSEYPELNHIAIFGELFGGGYPHPEVERDKQSVVIQKGIYYCPSNEFYAFDIMLDNHQYLSVNQANEIFDQANFFYARTLFTGSFNDALNYSNTFESKISGWLGLPAIENNVCEGVVIKPAIPAFFPNGSRVIIKNKNEKWEENTRNSKLILEQDKISDLAVKLAEIIKDYVTENRLNNVISKIGEVTEKDFGKLIGLLSKDVSEEFNKDYSSEFMALEKKEQKMIKKSLSKAASFLVRQEL